MDESDTTRDLLDRAEARWTDVSAALPDLRPAIALQRSLITRNVHAVHQLTGMPSAVQLGPEQILNKLDTNLPAFHGESVQLPVPQLKPLILAACDDLADGGAGDVARHVRGVLDAGRIDIESLLRASCERQQTAIRTKALHESIAPDLLWLVAEIAAGPAAFVTARTLLTEHGGNLAPAVSRALQCWEHGWCPACGSWPAFVETAMTNGAQMRCSFCGLGWPASDKACIYCRESTGLTSVKTEPDDPHRADLCSACGAYIKWLDFRESTPFELLPLEDLASAAVDELAAAQGVGRPGLLDFGESTLPPCQTLTESDTTAGNS